ncbi:MAG: L,D-transpeptidase family protein [Alphaproteobacteria bacterium]|jgi:L,D-peptidoglycan transpeptidase YkuD (ErfK/YbiS/YcfS/YnhG family)|nr:L,D-transpeptidase family protein [Alphaproteobacteria bacterium]MBT5389856.1 L,D-transpeptidase family protein [Alphaproteobacteria bacterium]MBT5540066.1 L,D-transpeptidase family protein [Alphaproteobacteria bacterium]MBT5654783.1 L,D-transpeptidase family protein [Alphaproteobacteria bacterium]
MKLIVRGNGIGATQGTAQWGKHVFPCALGRSGIQPKVKEWDGTTPIGDFPFRKVYARKDKISLPKTKLPLIVTEENMGWCDDAGDKENYNRPVELPYNKSHEKLWRDDDLYDVVLVIGHNDDPPCPGLGSAIFIHVAREGFSPTEGCIAFKLEDLQMILETATQETIVEIRP